MKVLQINTVYPHGSTGKIANGIYNKCRENGIECKIAYRYFESETYDDTIAISSWLDCHVHNRLVRWTGFQGCFSKIRTKRFVKIVEEYAPDIIHIHNIHGNYLNFKVFFDFLKRYDCKTVVTMHDCWALTGICPHFVMAKCEKWKNECHRCPYFKGYYLNLFDPVKFLHKRKKRYFLGIESLHVVANSEWTASMARQSYLKDCPIDVIYNGIDLSVFKPTISNVREQYGIENTDYLVLGVAFVWDIKKGLDVFVKLSHILDKKKYRIVLVGITKKDAETLPNDIIAIEKTNKPEELAALYSAADVFVNPTREEAFGLVNVEANACGTPVVAFDTGGCSESINDLSGCVVQCDDIDMLTSEIRKACEDKKYLSDDCMRSAKRFDKNKSYAEYINYYKNSVCTSANNERL